MIKITYLHTLYNREVTQNVFGDIKFIIDNSRPHVLFYSGGHGYRIACEYVRKIEEVGE